MTMFGLTFAQSFDEQRCRTQCPGPNLTRLERARACASVELGTSVAWGPVHLSTFALVVIAPVSHY